MENDVIIRSAEGYFEEYGRERIYRRKMDRSIVKEQLIRAVQNELFGTVAMRAKKQFKDIPKEGDPEALRIAHNVVRDVTKKWLKICRIFSMYSETSGLIKPEDLSFVPEEEDGIGFEKGELVTKEQPHASET